MTSLANSTVLIVDDDPLVAGAIATLIERQGRTVVVCHDSASAELALSEYPFTHVISDLQLSKDVSFEGVRFVDAARRAQPGSRIVVVSGYASQIVRSAALASGADAFLSKPFEESDICQALGDDLVPIDESQPSRLVHVQELDALIAGRAITSQFQPIVLLDGSVAVHGFEALARIEDGWPFADMKTLFDYAGRKRRVFELNRICIEAALREGAALTARGRLFINVDPGVVSTAGFADMLRGMASDAGVALDRLVLELTENVVSYDTVAAVAAIHELRAYGVEFAIDDAESAPANLPLIEQVQPAYLKLSSHVGASFTTDAKKGGIVRGMAQFARELGSSLVLEGIETERAAIAARDTGIPFGQGYFFSRATIASTAANF